MIKEIIHTARFLNMTNRQVVLHGNHGEIIAIPPSGELIRCILSREPNGSLNVEGKLVVPLYRTRFGEIHLLRNGRPEPIPEPREGVYYIVPAVVAQAAKDLGRTDFLVVDETITNNRGRVIGAKALAII